VSRLTQHEAGHWHDAKGHHRMPDPRTFKGYPERFWDSDEREYVIHLQAHEAEDAVPKPRPDDDDTIKALFANIENAENTIVTSRAIIRDLRAIAHARMQDS
jgi:hypothetical protein